jgi:hypothetical protein
MGFGAAALGKLFRFYTIITFVVFIAFGILIGVEAPGIPKNLPTPRIGIWERINIGAFMLWVIVLALVLLFRETNSRTQPHERTPLRTIAESPHKKAPDLKTIPGLLVIVC